MSLGSQLYDLQEIDLDLQTKAEVLDGVERELADNRAVAEAHAELEKKQQQLAKLEAEQRTAEWELDDSEAKAKPLEKKLYGGSVKSPKELLDLKQQVESLKAQIEEKEDKALEIMSQVERRQKEIAQSAAEGERLEKEWQARQEQLSAEQAELIAAMNVTGQRRDGLAVAVDPAALELYEALRERKQGRAVARIEQGRCQGCRIALPMSELQRARIGGALVQCSSCSRILYLG